MSTGKVLLGIVAGVAVGAALGVLYAPDKGSATRKNITKKGEDYAKDIKTKFNDLVDGAARKFDQVKDDASNLASEAVSQGKAKVEDAASKMSAANGRSHA